MEPTVAKQTSLSKRPRHSVLIQEEVVAANDVASDEDSESLWQDAADENELESLWPELDSWSFDIFKVANEDLPKMAERMFVNLGLFEFFPLDLQKFRAFVECMVAQYRSHVPYHNFRHACDVLHAMYLLLRLGGGVDVLNHYEMLALSIAALCHDVDHPGLTNTFLVACNDPLAIRYNDLSVLENHHASITVKALMGYESMNILGIFSDADQRYIRKLVVTSILATDMSYHATIVQSLESKGINHQTLRVSARQEYRPPPPKKSSTTTSEEKEESEESEEEDMPREPLTSTDDVVLIMKMVMKCADISNTIRPFALSKKWAALLLLEWFRQGDVERRLGMPISPNMDRNDPDSLQSMTLGCIDNLSIPMYEAGAVALPKLRDEVLPNLAANRIDWSAFSTAGPLEEEAENILGSFFPIQKTEPRMSIRTIRTSKSSISESSPPDETHQPKKASLTSSSTLMKAQKDRPLSLMFGAPLGQDVNTLASELAWNTTLRDSSIRINLVSTSRRSQPSLELADRSSIRRRSSFLALEELRMKEEEQDFLSRAGFCTRFRARALAVRLSKLFDSKMWAYFVAIPATLIALFLNDFNRAVCPKSFDQYVEVIYLLVLFIFLLDLVALSVLKQAYVFSFAFWLDLVGSLTLIPYMFGAIRQNLIVARVWKAAEALSRLAKLLQSKSSRVPSAFLAARLLKVVYSHIILRRKFLTHTDEEPIEDLSRPFMSSKPSYLWLRLSDLQSQRLVLGVLVLAIALPYFYRLPEDLAPTLSLAALDTSPLYTLRFNSSLDKLLTFNSDHGYEIIYLGCRDQCAPGYCLGSAFDPSDPFIQVIPPAVAGHDAKKEVTEEYRDSELIKAVSDTQRTEAFYSIRSRDRKDHVLNMGLTLITLFVLSTLSFLLSWDTNNLLIQPIEGMVNFIKDLADNPASFAGKSISRKTKGGGSGKVMETRMLEGALVKIASLSKVALGDAGMDILSVNLKGTEFNPMVPGKKVRACFGFCDIRNFTDATECLQEDVMMFVNKIADVVHNKVILHNGFPNKNVGDAFLVVWKKTISDGALKSKGSSFADRALRSFLDVIQALETSQSLHEYAMHPAIQQRMPGYRIRMGFGLHVGWAIEGAIGSSHKVDPSYLSPHVNMASRLEAATKQYGVMILISETVITNLTKSSLRDNCRKVDRVTVKGSAEPLTLYTYDLPILQEDLKALYPDYKSMFEAAVDSYIVGNWHTALEKLRECVNLWHSDYPARLLTSYIGSHKNMVPSNWKGYRELSEK